MKASEIPPCDRDKFNDMQDGVIKPRFGDREQIRVIDLVQEAQRDLRLEPIKKRLPRWEAPELPFPKE